VTRCPALDQAVNMNDSVPINKNFVRRESITKEWGPRSFVVPPLKKNTACLYVAFKMKSIAFNRTVFVNRCLLSQKSYFIIKLHSWFVENLLSLVRLILRLSIYTVFRKKTPTFVFLHNSQNK